MRRTIPNGYLIAIEGIDGAGKTTQAKALAAALQNGGIDVVQTKEPTDGQWGRKLRESAQTGRLSLKDELDLFIKDRREHVETLIKPALKAGKVVIVDRYYLSTVAYQGARGIETAHILDIHSTFAPEPDLLLILDVKPKVGLERIRARGDKANHFETEKNLREVAAIFADMKFKFLHRVDGSLPADAITQGILERLYSGPLSTRERSPAIPKDLDEVPNGEVWNGLVAAGGRS